MISFASALVRLAVENCCRLCLCTAACGISTKRIADDRPVVDVHEKPRSGDTAISITLSTKTLLRHAPQNALACRPEYAKE